MKFTKDTKYKRISVNLVKPILFMLFFSSCSFNGKLSYELTDKTTILNGDLIYENIASTNYMRFNLDTNTTSSLSIAIDDFGKNYESFFLSDQGVKRLFVIEEVTDIKAKLFECEYPSGIKLKTVLSFDKKGNDYFFNSMGLKEFYYCLMLDNKGNMINLHTKERRVINNEKMPFLFFNDKYIIIDQGKIFESDLIDMSNNKLLFEGENPLFCQTLNSIMYTSTNESKKTVKIYKLSDASICDTGIAPLQGDRFDKDRYKYYFLNEPYMIYGIADKGLINNFKASVLNIITGGMITDRPCKYIIYNYNTHKDVGYIKNATVLDIKTYF